jgi:hypothetical protein
VRTNEGDPAVALEGDSEVIAGKEFCQLVTLITPPLPETAAPVPFGRTPDVDPIDTATEEPLVAAASVTVTIAITPLAIPFSFTPLARQISDPFTARQVRFLPAFNSTGPAVILTEATSEGL